MSQAESAQTRDSVEPFGALLRSLRLRAGLTQHELAVAAGYQEGQIARLEQGRELPDREMLRERLIPALGLQHDPAQAMQLLALAEAASGSAGARHRNSGAQPPLLATKIFIPQAGHDLVLRRRLLAMLDFDQAPPLTLIVAPAGFGKTTLLASWLQQRNTAERGEPWTRAAWLALDAEDNDPATFLRYLIAAIQTLSPGLGAETLELIGTPLPPRRLLLAPLVNDLAAVPAGHVLVLDDYHLIGEPEVHHIVAFLLEHLLASGMRLAIASREEPPLPLARMRARRQLLEIRADDLRFSGEEVERFLGSVMQLRLAREDLALLEAHTEGWIAGLQLAALALKDRPAAAPLIAGISGNQRYILDYLAAEVLDRLPAHLRSFLLQTAILGRLCGPLCDALLGLEGAGRPTTAGGQSYSQLIIEELERRQLFMVPLDSERRWYRYHHLFAGFLRSRLLAGATESQLATLHQRASAWFERQELIEEAIHHALAGADMERATSLIAQAGLRIAGHGQAQTVLGWLRAIPDAQIHARPELCLMSAIILLNLNQPRAAAAWLATAERNLPVTATEGPQQALRGQALLARASLARISGDLRRCVAEAGQALALLRDGPPVFRAVAALNTAIAFLVSGDVTEASEHCVRQALAASQEAGNPAAHLGGLVMLGVLQTLQGRRRQAARSYALALQMLPTEDHARALSGAAAAYLYRGEWLREQNELDQAERELALGMALAQESVTVDAEVILLGSVAQSKIRLARADAAGALQALDRVAQTLEERSAAPQLLARAAAARALISLAAGDRPAAARWAKTLRPELSADDLFSREFEYLTLARVWLAQAAGASDLRRRALLLLSHLLADAETKARADSAIRIRTLQALALQAAGETEQALSALAPALAIAADEGYVRLFVDEGAPLAALLRVAGARGIEPNYTARLLATFPDASGMGALADQPGLPEPLTARELQILRLIAGGASNQGIADTLIISVGTVKKHVNNILGKLGVHSRTQALARARELGLL